MLLGTSSIPAALATLFVVSACSSPASDNLFGSSRPSTVGNAGFGGATSGAPNYQGGAGGGQGQTGGSPSNGGASYTGGFGGFVVETGGFAGFPPQNTGG